MPSIKAGNLNKTVSENPKTRGWFLGHFIEEPYCFKDDSIEVKWGIHKKGEKLDIVRATKYSKTLSILISGKTKISFPDENKDFILSEQGDFVFWEKEIFHTSDIIEDSVFLVIRWPSLPNNIITK